MSFCNIYIPPEIVDIIADFRDYEKYYKPKHSELLLGVINDIGDIAAICSAEVNHIQPNIVWQCWGPGAKYLSWPLDEEDDFEDHHIEVYNDPFPWIAESFTHLSSNPDDYL